MGALRVLAMVLDADLEEGISGANSGGKGQGKGKRQSVFDANEAGRKYLRVFETVPVQFLNAYGEARYNRMPDKAVWRDMKEPLKSGSAWMSEYCDPEVERQGVAVNRWLQPLVAWCKYQQQDSVRKENAAIMHASLLE